mgnify:CR=1 FL=1
MEIIGANSSYTLQVFVQKLKLYTTIWGIRAVVSFQSQFSVATINKYDNKLKWTFQHLKIQTLTYMTYMFKQKKTKIKWTHKTKSNTKKP